MKKYLLCTTLILSLVISLCGCTATNDDTNTSQQLDKIGDTIDYTYPLENMGKWYGFGTDGENAQFEIDIKEETEWGVLVTINGWGDNSNFPAEQLSMIYMDDKEEFRETTDAKERRIFRFYTNEFGKEVLEIKVVDKESGEQLAESIEAGRYSDRNTAFGENVSEVEQNPNSSAINNAQSNSNTKNNFQQRYNQLNSKVIKDAPQQEMNMASSELYDEWDVLLNDIYNYLKTVKSTSEFEVIKKDEISWITERDAAVEKSRSEYAGGSMAPLAANTTAIECTKQRCNYLISLIN